MSTRIALEIAAELDLEDGVVCREAAAVIRAQHAEIERLTAERDSAIAAAVAAEREACAAVLAAMADSECLRSRIIALMQAAKAIRARAKP